MRSFSQPLRPGEQLGAYRILSRLGSGGMGEVYLAEDSRLGRRVALKVLLPELALDPSAMKRFEREACAASALNHPSILTIHELGRDGDTAYIVGEYVDGGTLRERLDGGPLPLREVVNIGTQIASALAVAHGAGIVHRDLKPENVMLRRDGLVKVLDFGLAKQLPHWAVEADTATIERTTETGTVLGTIDYMSPEQVRGRSVDARSDIFSLAGNRPEAIQRRRRLLEQYPNDKESLFAIGDLSFHTNDYATAREYLRRTLDADPNYLLALDHLVLTGLSSGDPTVLADAERYAKQAQSSASFLMLCWLYFAMGRDAEAVALAKENADRNPQENDFSAIRRYVYALLRAGDREGARREAKRLLAYPDAVRRGRYELSLAVVAVDEGRFRQAIELLEKGADIAAAGGERSHAGYSLANRATLLALSGRVPEARAAVASLLSGQADLSMGWAMTFATAIFLDDPGTARSVLAKRKAAEGDEARSLVVAAEARRRGDSAAAFDALLHRPFGWTYDWYAARCALEAGRLDEAEASVKRLASGAYAFSSIAATEHLLGRIEEARGNRAAAKKHYEKVLERWRNADPDLPELIDTKARLAKL